MYLLESPLEALAFRYSAALAGSAWTWLAVVFAALGFWRIRLVGSTIKPDPKPEPPQVAAKPTEAVIVGHNDNKDPPMRRCHVDRKGDCSLTKGRFTAYFHVEDNGHGYECDGVSDVAYEEEETPLWRPEGMRGDLGWYRYVDLTAIDGSVVRLWDRYGESRRRV